MNTVSMNNGVYFEVNSTSLNSSRKSVSKKLFLLVMGLCVSEAAIKNNVVDQKELSKSLITSDTLNGKIKDTKIESESLPSKTAKSVKSLKKAESTENMNMFSELPFAGVDFTDLFGNSTQSTGSKKTSYSKSDAAEYKAVNKENNEVFAQMLKHRMAERISDDEKLSKALISTVSGNKVVDDKVVSKNTERVVTSDSSSKNNNVLSNNGTLVDESILDSLDLLLSQNTDSFKSIVEAKRNHAGTFEDAGYLKNLDQSAFRDSALSERLLSEIGLDSLSQDTFLLLVIIADEFVSALQDYFRISMWMSFGNMMLTPEFAYDYGINYELLTATYNDFNNELLSNMFSEINYTGDMSDLNISTLYESLVVNNAVVDKKPLIK